MCAQNKHSAWFQQHPNINQQQQPIHRLHHQNMKRTKCHPTKRDDGLLHDESLTDKVCSNGGKQRLCLARSRARWRWWRLQQQHNITVAAAGDKQLTGSTSRSARFNATIMSVGNGVCNVFFVFVPRRRTKERGDGDSTKWQRVNSSERRSEK